MKSMLIEEGKSLVLGLDDCTPQSKRWQRVASWTRDVAASEYSLLLYDDLDTALQWIKSPPASYLKAVEKLELINQAVNAVHLDSYETIADLISLPPSVERQKLIKQAIDSAPKEEIADLIDIFVADGELDFSLSKSFCRQLENLLDSFKRPLNVFSHNILFQEAYEEPAEPMPADEFTKVKVDGDKNWFSFRQIDLAVDPCAWYILWRLSDIFDRIRKAYSLDEVYPSSLEWLKVKAALQRDLLKQRPWLWLVLNVLSHGSDLPVHREELNDYNLQFLLKHGPKDGRWATLQNHVAASLRIAINQMIAYDKARDLAALEKQQEAHAEPATAEPAPAKPAKPAKTRPTKDMTDEGRLGLIAGELKKNPNATDAKLGSAIGVDERTIRNWKKKPMIAKAWRNISIERSKAQIDHDKASKGRLNIDGLDQNSPNQNLMRKGRKVTSD